MHRKIVLFTVLLLLVSAVQAQETLPLNQLTVGEITSANPNPAYRITAAAGQSLQIEVVEVTFGLAPQFTLNDANGALVQAVGNPSLSSNVVDTMAFVLAGDYVVSVSSVNGTTGQFVIRISEAAPAIPPTALGVGQPINGTLNSGQQVIYVLTGDPAAPLLLTIDGRVSLTLKTASGDILATMGSQIAGGALYLPASPETYQLMLFSDADAVNYVVALNPRGATLPLPITTPEVGPTEVGLPVLPTSGACVLATLRNEAVNVRQGPATEFSQITRLSAQTVYNVVGRNSDGSWWEIDYGGGRGWVAGFVTRRGGDCSNVPLTYIPPSPQPTTPPTEPGPTPRIAGDNEVNIEFPYQFGLRSGFFGELSYPQGNREDTFTYRLTGTIPLGVWFHRSIRCTGDTEFAVIEFPNGTSVPCTTNERSNSELISDTGVYASEFTIKLTGGDNAYVEWIVYLEWPIP
jgi:hypothetical protein